MWTSPAAPLSDRYASSPEPIGDGGRVDVEVTAYLCEGLPGGIHAGGGLEFLVGPAVVGAAGESSASDVSQDGRAVDAVSGGDVTDRLPIHVRLQDSVNLVWREAPLDLPNRAGTGRV